MKGVAVQIEDVLRAAEDLGIPMVGIGIAHKMLGNESFPWPKHSLFTPTDSEVDGWPSAWALAKRTGLWAGVGNHGQAQINRGNLPAGVWIKGVDGWSRLA